jgi:hypothetical protein
MHSQDAAAEAATAAATEVKDIMEPMLWTSRGWTARVKKNEDDEGWAVEMYRVGDSEPALVGPWTMGRDKKNPKPLNPKDFQTLVKTASEFLERATQAQRNALHKSTDVIVDGTRFRVDLDIAADEDDPHAIVKATNDVTGEVVRSQRVAPSWKLTSKSAAEVVAGRVG